jgi:hypothetical protein
MAFNALLGGDGQVEASAYLAGGQQGIGVQNVQRRDVGEQGGRLGGRCGQVVRPFGSVMVQ